MPLIFGRLTDTLARKKMFTLILVVYLVGAAASELAPTMWVFMQFRFVSETIVDGIEREVRDAGGEPPRPDESQGRWIKAGEGPTPKQLAYVLFKLYPTRTVLGATLMITQSFPYNAIFFTYALALRNCLGGLPDGLGDLPV